MFDMTLHISADELLLTLDREASPHRLGRVRRHLAECPECRARMEDMDRRLEETRRLHHAAAPILPPATAARAELQRRLALPSPQPSRPLAAWASAAAAIGVVAWLGLQGLPAGASLFSHVEDAAVFLHPRPDLTPGLVRPVTVADVCGAGRYGRSRPVPASVHQRVFESYGARYDRVAEYELDHLITPELGGASDVANLWPQPYAGTPWNAYVKDELEMHLHWLVCEGQIDLATAQREIAIDWIAAYKRHFRRDRPRRDYAVSPPGRGDLSVLLSELDEQGLGLHASHADTVAQLE